MGLAVGNKVVTNSWRYMGTKAGSQQFDWFRFARGVNARKEEYQSKVTSISNVHIPYPVVNPVGLTSSDEGIIANLDRPEPSARMILDRQMLGMQAEYEYARKEFGQDPIEAIDVLGSMNKYMTENMSDIMETAVGVAYSGYDLKNRAIELAREARAGHGDVERFKTETEKIFDGMIMSLEDAEDAIKNSANMENQGLDINKFINQVKGLKEKFKLRDLSQIKDPKKLGMTISGTVMKPLGSMLEQSLAIQIQNQLGDFVQSVVKGDEKHIYNGIKFPQGKTDVEVVIETSRIGISAKNYWIENGSSPSFSAYKGNLDNLLTTMKWDNELKYLTLFSKRTEARDYDAMNVIMSAAVASYALAGTPGDRVQIMAYANRLIPAYEYMNYNNHKVKASVSAPSANALKSMLLFSGNSLSIQIGKMSGYVTAK